MASIGVPRSNQRVRKFADHVRWGAQPTDFTHLHNIPTGPLKMREAVGQIRDVFWSQNRFCLASSSNAGVL